MLQFFVLTVTPGCQVTSRCLDSNAAPLGGFDYLILSCKAGLLRLCDVVSPMSYFQITIAASGLGSKSSWNSTFAASIVLDQGLSADLVISMSLDTVGTAA